MTLTPEQVAAATQKPLANVQVTWPRVLAALSGLGIGQVLVQVAAAATIGVETPAFLPVRELRANKIRQPALWASQERYWPSGFYGRGLVQTTWEKNYRALEEATGIPCVADPNLLLQPQEAAMALAHYFKANNVHIAAMRQDWRATRKLVNGGWNGWEHYSPMVDRLLAAAGLERKSGS